MLIFLKYNLTLPPIVHVFLVLQQGYKLYATTFEDCYNPHCKSVSDYYGEGATCSMYSWNKARDPKWSSCHPKDFEYKDKNFGYRTTDISSDSYVGIQECMEYTSDDEWCQDCNKISGTVKNRK